ncbi:Orn/Lys/Arg decarboxylase N-terminal domain-containing protein, partial [Burkholderia arboris]|uniref:Orn/Lys/Arg decarboxylase N-terminal domain-containing protein n=1 Tax=Burkholderia arboris TaxID=488730 RepID=UPI00292A447F
MNTSVGGIRRLGMRALLVDDEITQETATGRAVRTLSAELVQRDIDVLTATSADDAIVLIRSDPSIQCVLLDWDLGVGGARGGGGGGGGGGVLKKNPPPPPPRPGGWGGGGEKKKGGGGGG